MSFDAGLQPERTALAWRRTGLVAAVAALALARAALTRGSPAIAAVLVSVLVVAAATLFQGIGELRRRQALERIHPTLPLAATVTTIVITMLAVAGIVLVWVG